MVCFFPAKILPKESFLRLCGGSSMIRLRSPRSFRSTGLSHTDKCMVGLKKNTLSSPVHTTHLHKRKRDAFIHSYTHRNTIQQAGCGILTAWLRNPDDKKQSQQHQSDPERGFWVTNDSWEPLRPDGLNLIVWFRFWCIFVFTCYFSIIIFQQVHKIFKWINPQYVLHQVSTSLLYI